MIVVNKDGIVMTPKELSDTQLVQMYIRMKRKTYRNIWANPYCIEAKDRGLIHLPHPTIKRV